MSLFKITIRIIAVQATGRQTYLTEPWADSVSAAILQVILTAISPSVGRSVDECHVRVLLCNFADFEVCGEWKRLEHHLGVSENSVYPKPNGFADHYPYEKWLFHWEYTQHFQTNPFIKI